MIESVTRANLDDLLPLMRAYQLFYQNDQIDEARNRTFFGRFCDDSSRGCQFLIRDKDSAVGFATLYFTFSSQLADDVTLLNDLFVLPEYRGRGFGKRLIEHCHRISKARNTARLQWFTEEANKEAQRLYNRMGRLSGHWKLYVRE